MTTLKELFKSQRVEDVAIKRKCWHNARAIDCKSCDEEAEKTVEDNA